MTYRHICQLGLLLSVLTQAPTVRADDDEMIVLGVLGAGLVLSDVAFFVRDVALLANESEPDVGVSIVEAAVTTPQALFMNAGMAIIAHEHYVSSTKKRRWSYPPR